MWSKVTNNYENNIYIDAALKCFHIVHITINLLLFLNFLKNLKIKVEMNCPWSKSLTVW
jgi:hypothetical protein